jgi:scpA/B protein
MQEEKENIEVQQDTVNKYENYINKYNRENKKTEISKYSIKIEDFEGPLDLLCFLVKKNKMNIDDINIYKIIEEYLEYMYIMESLNLEVATEFITMASMLIYLKSKKILPKSCDDKEEDEISEELLKEKIIQYKKYKQASISLSSRYEEYNYRVSKKREELVLDKKEFEGLYTPYTLTRSYKLQILKFEMKENMNKDNIEKLVIKEKVSVKDKIKEMFTILSKIPKFVFNKMFLNKNKSKDEIISAFLGILEMAKKNDIKIKQENIFSDILVEKSNEK